MTDRRDLMKLVALGGGAVYLSGLAGCAASAARATTARAYEDFYFEIGRAHV